MRGKVARELRRQAFAVGEENKLTGERHPNGTVTARYSPMSKRRVYKWLKARYKRLGRV